MSLTQEQVLHIANLSRLHIEEKDVGRYQHDLNSIVEYVDMLDSVDVSDIPQSDADQELMLPLRTDEPSRIGGVTREDLLSCSKKQKVNHSITIGNIMH